MMSGFDETTISLEVGRAGPAATEGGDGAVLEARLGGAESGAPAVVAAPHPLMGGSLDNPVVEALTAGLARSGRRTLRFNWRGVGRSTGTPSGDVADAVADYHAALAYFASTAAIAPALVAAGYSFGSIAALRAATEAAQHAPPAGPRVERFVLVAPPLAMLALPELERVQVAVHVIVGEHDEYAPVDSIRASLGGLEAARLDVVAGADHFFSTTDPQQLVSLVAAGAASAPDEPDRRDR